MKKQYNFSMSAPWLAMLCFALHFSCAELPAEDDGNGDGPDNPDVGVVTNDAFYVRVFEDTQTEYFAHKNEVTHPVTGGYDVECEIDTDDSFTADTHDIKCVVEAPELDLYHLGLKLQFNVPQDACVWLRRSAPRYFQFEPKIGVAGTIEYFKDAQGSVYWTRVCDGLGNPRTVAPAGQAFNPQTQDPTAVFGAGCVQGGTNPVAIEGPTAVLGDDFNVTVDGAAYCNANYSLFEYSNAKGDDVVGPDLCRGIMRTIVYNQDPVTPANYLPAEVEDTDFSPNLQDGVVGPGADTDFESAAVFDTFVENTGLNATYEILKSNLDAPEPYFGVGYAANYIDVGSTVPPAVLSQFYDFTCLDRNEEIQARIRVEVRKWDAYSEFDDYREDGSGDAESGGAHDYGNGVCTVADPNFPNSCVNDNLDWDAIIAKPSNNETCDQDISGFNRLIPDTYPGACF